MTNHDSKSERLRRRRLTVLFFLLFPHSSISFLSADWVACHQRSSLRQQQQGYLASTNRPGGKSAGPSRPRQQYTSRQQQEPQPQPQQGHGKSKSKPKSDAYQEAAALLRSSRNPPAYLLQWLQRLQRQKCESQRPRLSSFYPYEQTDFIKSLAERDAYDAMLYYLHHFSDRSVYAYTCAISCLARSKTHGLDRALELLFQDMTQANENSDGDHQRQHGASGGPAQPNKYTLTAVWSHVRGAAQARRVMDLLEKDETTRQAARCTEVYNAAIHACTRSNNDKNNYNSNSNNNKNTDDDNDWQTAFYFYFRMKQLKIKPNLSTYSSLLLACGKAQQVKVAMSLLLHEMPTTMEPNEIVWGAALTVCAKAGDYAQAAQLLKRISQSSSCHITTRHVSSYLAALARAGQDQQAIKVLRALQQQVPIALAELDFVLPPVPLDLVMITTVLHACAQVGNYPDARRILTELKEGRYVTTPSFNGQHSQHRHHGRPGRQRQGEETIVLQPDENTYNTVLKACHNNAQEAKALVKEMRLSQRHRYNKVPRPTTKTYTLAISACRDDLDTALFLLRDSQHDGIQTPNVFMYSAAIWAAVPHHNPTVALELLDEMKAANVEPNEITYGGVIAALAQEGRVQEAVDLYVEMKRERKLRANDNIFARLLTAIQNALSQDADLNVLPLLETIVEHFDPAVDGVGGASPILELLILEYGMNDRFEDALYVFDTILPEPVDAPCLRAMLSACALAPNQWQQALSILHTSDIVEGAGGPARVDMRAIGFTMLACSKSGEWAEAYNLLELYGRKDVAAPPPPPQQKLRADVKRNNSNNDSTVPRSAINSLMTACGRGRRPDMALRLLNEMESRYGVKPNEISYRSAAIACNQAQHDQERRRRRRQQNDQQMQGEEEDFDDKDFPHPTSTTTLQWWECALSLLRRMKEDGLEPDVQTLSSVISACEAAGEWQRALGVLRTSIQSTKGSNQTQQLNLYCFNAAISACEKGGAWVEALELYYLMLDDEENGGSIRPNFVTLSALLIALDKASQAELAQDLYEQALSLKLVRPPWTRTRCPHTGALIQAMDLHHHSTAMAKNAIRSVLESMLVGSTSSSSTSTTKKKKNNPAVIMAQQQQELVVIVGKGKGSRYHQVLLPTVETILKQDYGIACHLDPANAGRLVVPWDELESFMMRRRQ